MHWRCRHRTIDLTRPVVMGILNVTPIHFPWRRFALSMRRSSVRVKWRRRAPQYRCGGHRPAGALK